MNKALKYFLNNSLGDLATNCPDEGIDYIFMLENEDWQFLAEEWKNRNISWREGITYFAGFIELNISKKILFKAINSMDNDVIEQGLLSLHQCIVEENENQIIYSFTDKEKKSIDKVLRYNEKLSSYPECQELLKFINK